jgi:probable F420-dependent oxidoreductase
MTAKQAVGRVGVWTAELRTVDPNLKADVADAAAELDELGYGAIWLGRSPGVDNAAQLLDATPRVAVATGILSIWQHPARDVAAEVAAVRQRYPDRFVLGLGASHAHLVEGYQRPYTKMREYLDELDTAPAPVPVEWRVLAALGPKMLALAGERTAGAHPYMVSVEHTAQARETLGPDALLAPEVNVVLETDRDQARTIARDRLGPYLKLPNYASNLRRLGFGDDDLAGGGSDRLVDALFVWGDADTVVARTEEYFAAGADHLCFQVARAPSPAHFPRDEWRRLAEILGLAGAAAGATASGR